MGKPTEDDELRRFLEQELARLAAEGLIYDTGQRRNGQIVWAKVPGKEGELICRSGSK